MIIKELDKQYVLATLGKGTKVVMCDFGSIRMIDCGEMVVNSIVAFMEKDTVKFFTVAENE